MNSSTDASSHLSDSDFWRLCHDLPALNKCGNVDTYPSAITITTVNPNANNRNNNMNPFDGIVSMLDDTNESDEGIDPIKHSDESDEAAQSSSDDSLHNLYAKKNQANDLFIESHAISVNTKRIYDTIELIGDNLKQNGGDAHDIDAKYNSLTSDESSNGSGSTTTATTTTTTTTTSASNADDLLIKIAKNLKQLKENVAEIEISGKIDALFDGDLIDFNDDNVHKFHECNGEFDKYNNFVIDFTSENFAFFLSTALSLSLSHIKSLARTSSLTHSVSTIFNAFVSHEKEKNLIIHRYAN